MESIRDVLKQLKTIDFEQQSSALMARIVGDGHVKAFLAAHPEVDESMVKTNANRLFAYAREAAACANCPGLDQCPNDIQGHATELRVIEGTVIEDVRVACSKLETEKARAILRGRIKSFYLDPTLVEHGYQLSEMITCDRDRAMAVDRVHDYVSQALAGPGLPTKGLYLYGPLGTGKTYLLGYVMAEFAKKGFQGVMVYVPDFVEEAKGWISEPGKLKEMIELLKEADVLVFDDIGAESVSPWIRDHVFATILNYRMNRKPTLFSSNYSLDGLEKHLSFSNREGEEEFKGKRLMERIRPYVVAIDVNGHNKRK
jgi:primosomal protein DnaI